MNTLAYALKKVPQDTNLGKMVAAAENKQKREPRAKKTRVLVKELDAEKVLVRDLEDRIFKALLGKDKDIFSCSSLQFRPGKLVKAPDGLARIRGCLHIEDSLSLVLLYEKPRKMAGSTAYSRLDLIDLDAPGVSIEMVG